MRIYTDIYDLAGEVERDLFEMGVDVHPQTMQDKVIGDNPEYATKELQTYCFKYHREDEDDIKFPEFVNRILTGKRGHEPHPDYKSVMGYIDQEHLDRTGGYSMNPGYSYKHRVELWSQFQNPTTQRFHYTYSERMTPQLSRICDELKSNPDTRQAIVNLHSNICPTMTADQYSESDKDSDGQTLSDSTPSGNPVTESVDLRNMGGVGRIPCSMYYQFMIRDGKLDIVYTMRSCDFLTHFPVDIVLALKLQDLVADTVGIPKGSLTYFAGSLHAYSKDMAARGIF